MENNSKFKLFGFYYLLLVFLEFSYMFISYNLFLKESIINRLVFLFIIAFVITLITSLFNEKVNKIIAITTFAILSTLYSFYLVFYRIFNVSFSFSVFKLSGQALKFPKNIVLGILQNLHYILILFIPLIGLIIYLKYRKIKRISKKNYLAFIIIFLISSIIFLLNTFIDKDKKFSFYQLYFKVNDNNINIERLGVLNASFLDINRLIFGFEEELKVEEKPKEKEVEKPIVYQYNDGGIDYKKLLNKSKNNNINKITKFLNNEEATKKNLYTGIFEGKNLIYITAESFSEIGIRKDLTPTLYKLVNEGFNFQNFYSSNNLSTIGGEFQSLTGLYANNNLLSKWKEGRNAFPYSLNNTFKKKGYNTYAYHNHYFRFQSRNQYLKSLGFNNYLACGNGLERRINCKRWPESDLEMIDATVKDYINSKKPFLAYYITVSGHMRYNFYGNSIAMKNKAKVDKLKLSTSAKAYIATQIELDKALESLIKQLDEANKLKDTVIVLLCDHYPYALSIDEVNELSTYKRDSVVEIDHNALIIWNSELPNIKINKVAMSIDVIPTVYNLFNIEYDSRLFMGKDIFSDHEGIAFFKNRSWITNKGTYYASQNKFVAKDHEKIDKDYINRISNIVANRRIISQLIINNDYYRFIMNNK